MFAMRAEMRRSLLWLVALCCLSPLQGLSAAPLPQDQLDFLVDYWSQAEGLPQASVWAISQDRNGYLWIGSEEGLARFDGQRFTIFDTSNTPTFHDNWFRLLYLDPEGNLWAGNRSGDLLRYSETGFQRPTGWPKKVSNLEVHALLPHPEGGFWLATDGGLKWLDGEEKLHPITLGGLSQVMASTLATGPGRGLFVGSQQGLYRLAADGTSVTRHLGNRSITSLYTSPEGQLWVGTSRGLLRFDLDSSSTDLSLPVGLEPLASPQIFSFLRDRLGDLWIGSDQGLFRLRNPDDDEDFELEHYPAPEILPDRHVTALFEDSVGDLWIGSRYGSLIRFSTRYIERLGVQEGLIDDLVWSVFEDREDYLWIATDGGLGRRAPDGTLEHFTTLDGLPANEVGALLEDRRGTLWIGTFGDGLVSYRRGTFDVDLSQPAFLTSIRVLYEDREQHLWVGADGGLVRRDDHGDHAWGTADGLPHETIRGLHQDQSGTIWVATLGGLARFREDRAPAFEPLPQPFPGRPKSFLGDPDGTLWIGTWDDGLIRYRQGQWTLFRVTDGLFDRRIHCVLDDHQGGLWMSSNRGIFRVQRKELEAFAAGRTNRITSVIFDEADGMRSSECNGASQPAGWCDRAGRLWFPTLRGVVAINDEALESHVGRLRPVIEELMVDQEPYPLTPHPILPPLSKSVSFRYTAPSFNRAADIRFRYRLVGFDQDWIEAGNERLIQYTNLPPGPYRFEVQARSAGGAWNPEPARLELELRPAFFETPLFWGLCAILVALGAWGLVRLRLHRLLTTNRELERIRRELEAKNAMIRAQNAELEGFAYTVSHDLKNPLFTIEGFLGFLEKDLHHDPERAAANLQRVRGAARTMRRLLDELLELSRIGRLVYPEEAIELGDLVLEALALVEGQIVERGVRVVVPPSLPVVWGDRTRLLQVFQNLISNAVKYMGDQGRPLVEIAARRQGDEVLCHVRDNGCGIDPAYCQRVFQLFEQLDPKHEGTGVGLAIVQRVIEIHNGRIWVESKGLGHGSTFFFTLPATPSTKESP